MANAAAMYCALHIFSTFATITVPDVALLFNARCSALSYSCLPSPLTFHETGNLASSRVLSIWEAHICPAYDPGTCENPVRASRWSWARTARKRVPKATWILSWNWSHEGSRLRKAWPGASLGATKKGMAPCFVFVAQLGEKPKPKIGQMRCKSINVPRARSLSNTLSSLHTGLTSRPDLPALLETKRHMKYSRSCCSRLQ